MKRFLFIVVALNCIMLSFGEVYTIKRGTPIYVNVIDAIHSTDRNPRVVASVAHDVLTKDGQVAIYSGTPVLMSVDVQKAKTIGGPGQIQLLAITTSAVDNSVVNLHGGYTLTGEDRKGVAYGLAFGTGIFPLFGLGFAFLAIKGEDVTISPNTMIFSISIANDIKVDIPTVEQ